MRGRPITDDEIVDVMLGQRKAFSIWTICAEAGATEYKVKRVVERLVKSGDLQKVPKDSRQDNMVYVWVND